MKPNVESIVAISRGFESAREDLERLRIERIRNSNILKDGPILQSAFESAKFLGVSKPISGLVELRRILSKIKP